MTGKEFLPIGTIVKLNNYDNKVMITGYCMKSNSKTFHYCGVTYPEGINKSEGYLYYNKGDIRQIVKIGYMDQECIEILDKVKQFN